jgi:hypothetical protein
LLFHLPQRNQLVGYVTRGSISAGQRQNRNETNAMTEGTASAVPRQLTLFHLCCTCNNLVPFDLALRLEPESPGANYPLHPACKKADTAWNPYLNAFQRPLQVTGAASQIPSPTA